MRSHLRTILIQPARRYLSTWSDAIAAHLHGAYNATLGDEAAGLGAKEVAHAVTVVVSEVSQPLVASPSQSPKPSSQRATAQRPAVRVALADRVAVLGPVLHIQRDLAVGMLGRQHRDHILGVDQHATSGARLHHSTPVRKFWFGLFRAGFTRWNPYGFYQSITQT